MAGYLVGISIDGISQLQKMQALLAPASFDKAKASGLRYAAKATSPAVAKAVRARYNIPGARIKQDTSGPFIRQEEATLVFSRRPPTLAQYGFRPGKRGRQRGLGRGMGWAKPSPQGKPATAQIIRGSARLSYPRSFLKGNLPFTVRKSGKLTVEHGPSIGSLFLANSQYGEAIRSEVGDRINEQFITGMQRALDSAARGYGGSK